MEVIVEDRMGNKTPIQCIVLDKTCGNAQKFNIDHMKSYFKGKKLPDDLVSDGGEIDLLIGMSCPRLHQQVTIHEGNTLSIIETRFGPALVGTVPNENNEEESIVCRITLDDDEEEKFMRLLENEIAGIKKECECQLKSDEEILFERNPQLF